jgi:hypothetical protein
MHEILSLLVSAYQMSYISCDDMVLTVIDFEYNINTFTSPYDVFDIRLRNTEHVTDNSEADNEQPDKRDDTETSCIATQCNT